MTYNHAMIDLETMGTAQDTVVMSCGLVMFSPEEGTISETNRDHIVLNVQSQLDAGRTITGDTLKWWLRQSPEAVAGWNRAEEQCLTLQNFLEELRAIWKMYDARYVWGHGATFDISILENMYKYGGLGTPWKFWDVRDTRTLFHLTGVKPNRAEGTHHNALDDAIAQAHAVNKAWALTVMK